MIVTNRDNFFEICGSAAKELLGTLFAAADGKEDGEEKAVIYYADRYDDAVKNWDNLDENLYNSDSPNSVAGRLDRFIADRINALSAEYLLIAGGDEILPFYRLYHDGGYNALTVTSNNYYFSDAVYADTDGDYAEGGADVAFGRIAGASANDMANLISRGLAGPQGDNDAVIAAAGGIDDPGFTNVRALVGRVFAALKDDFNIITDGTGDFADMVETEIWTARDLADAIYNRGKGAKYVIIGSHGHHDSLSLSIKLGPQACRDRTCRLTDNISCIDKLSLCPDVCEKNDYYDQAVNACGEKQSMYDYLSEKGYSLNEMLSYLLSRGCGEELEHVCLAGDPDPYTQWLVRCEFAAKDADSVAHREGSFVAMMACYAGAIEERSTDPGSCLPYQFIHKGACGYFGSSASIPRSQTGNCPPDGKYTYGEELFNSFFEDMRTEGNIGKSYMIALNEYRPVNRPWDEKDSRTLTEFHLYGIPWTDSGLPRKGKRKREVSGDEKGYIKISEPERVKNRDTVKSEIRSGGTFSRTYSFAVTDYSITGEDSFDFVNIPGTVTSFGAGKPVLPCFEKELSLPKGASVKSLRLIYGSTQSLGRLNIPSLPGDSETSSGYTDVSDVSGLYPDPGYSYLVRFLRYYDKAIIFFGPVQYNTDTKETTLWTEGVLEIEYETDECIFISDLRADKWESEWYLTTEPVVMTATVENAGDADISGLTAVVIVKDTGEIANLSRESIANVPAGGSTEVSVTLENGLSTEHYIAEFEIRDENDAVLASASKWFRVKSDEITAFAAPSEYYVPGDVIPFAVTFQNYNPHEVAAENITVNIYESYTYTATAEAPPETVPANSSKDITVCLDTSEIPPGKYRGRSSVTVGGNMRSSDSFYFIIKEEDDLDCDFGVGLSDAVLALKVQASGEMPEDFCFSDADGDGKIGLAEAVHILRRLAEILP